MPPAGKASGASRRGHSPKTALALATTRPAARERGLRSYPMRPRAQVVHGAAAALLDGPALIRAGPIPLVGVWRVGAIQPVDRPSEATAG